MIATATICAFTPAPLLSLYVTVEVVADVEDALEWVSLPKAPLKAASCVALVHDTPIGPVALTLEAPHIKAPLAGTVIDPLTACVVELVLVTAVAATGEVVSAPVTL